jgi:intein/homing endonuclease
VTRKELIGDLEIIRSISESGAERQLLKAPKTSWIEKLIHLDGKPFSFKGREYLYPIYNTRHPKKLLVFGRQCEKSTMLANEIITDSVIIPYYKTLYVSPSFSQTRGFSNQKLRPWIHDSPMISKYFISTSTSDQVLERSFTNSSMCFLRAAFLTADRVRGLSANKLCLAGSTVIYKEDFTPISMEDLIKQGCIGARIWTLNESTMIPEVDTIVEAQIKKEAPLLRVSTESGSYVDLTEDHPVLTWEGWKLAKDLKEGFDHVVEVKQFPQVDIESSLSEDDCFIAGCLLGDGRHANFSRVTFSTTSDDLLNAFATSLKNVGAVFSINSYPRVSNLSGKNITENVVAIYGGREGYKSKLAELGIIGQETATKSVSFFSKITNQKLVLATLSGLFATDGYIMARLHKGRSGRHEAIRVCEFGYVSTSKSLSQNVVLLLKKLGINSHIRLRRPSNGISKKDQYIVLIRDTENFCKLAGTIHIPGKSKKLVAAANMVRNGMGKGKAYLLPITNKQLIKKIHLAGKTLAEFRRAYSSNLGNNDSRTSQQKVMAVASFIGDEELKKLASTDIIYRKVTSIKPLPPEVVYDFTMQKNHNFFANNICVHNCLDEVQDLLTANIPVIEECLSHTQDPTEILSGTPKSLDNPIESFWKTSSQCEWLVPCDRHLPVHWNYLDTKCIGKYGPICNKCGHSIDPSKGKWVAFSKSRDIMGFRVSQLQVPWYQNPSKWKELLIKYETLSKGVFHNEALGISYDSASKPISRVELMKCCSSQYQFRSSADSWVRKMPIFMGIDWGEGTDGTERGIKGKVKNASYTIVTLGTYIDPNHFHILYFKKYTGKEALPGNCVGDIINIIRNYNVLLVGADWGHGWGVNERIEEAIGMRRLVKFQHIGNQKDRMKYDDIGHKYQLSRNEVMTEFFLNLKDCKILFPHWDTVKEFLEDYENIYAEYRESSRSMHYDHKSSEPDDAFHSSLYCLEAANIYYSRKL